MIVGAIAIATILIALNEAGVFNGLFTALPADTGADATDTSSQQPLDSSSAFMAGQDPGDASSAPLPAYNPVDAPADGSPGLVDPNKIQFAALGSAMAEGFYATGNPIPKRANNPGDLTRSWGFPTKGTANSEGVLIFDTVEHGWQALYAQWGAMLNGTSTEYTLDMTILQVAEKWTGSQNAASWAATCAQYMGVPVTTTLQEYLDA